MSDECLYYSQLFAFMIQIQNTHALQNFLEDNEEEMQWNMLQVLKIMPRSATNVPSVSYHKSVR